MQDNIHSMIVFDYEKHLTSSYCEMSALYDFTIVHTTERRPYFTANPSGVLPSCNR